MVANQIQIFQQTTPLQHGLCGLEIDPGQMKWAQVHIVPMQWEEECLPIQKWIDSVDSPNSISGKPCPNRNGFNTVMLK